MSDDMIRTTLAQELWWTVRHANQVAPARPRRRLDGVDDVIVAARRLHVPIEVAALEGCLRMVATRHEALRTGLVHHAGLLHQRIEPDSSFSLRFVDLSGQPPDRALDQVAALARGDARRPFELERPLVRGFLARLGPEDHVLVLSVLHAVFDDFSHQLVVNELRALYAEIMGAPQPRRLPAPVPFRRFSEWQLGWQNDERLRGQYEYWARKLEGYSAAVNLPVLRPRVDVELDTRSSVRTTIPAAQWATALAVARDERVTPFVLVIAALSAALADQAEQDEVAIGVVYANRRLPWMQAVMGLLANTLLLRTSLASSPTFRGLLRQVAATWLEALSNGEFPFDELARSLGVSRLPGRGGAQAHEVLVNFLVPSAQTDDDRPSWMQAWSPPEEEEPAEWAGCLLHVTFWIAPDGRLEARFSYTRELLSPEVVTAVANRFQSLVCDVSRRLELPATGQASSPPHERDPAAADSTRTSARQA